MYSIGVLCLLSVAVALAKPELLHTNLPAPPPPLEVEANPPPLDKPQSAEAKNPLDSTEKPKAEKDEDKDILDDAFKVIQKESKESKESKDSNESKDVKEKSIESKETSKYNKDIGQRPEEQKEEKKEKDSKSEGSKDQDEEEGPITKPNQNGFISNFFPNFHLPWPFSYFAPKFRNGGQQPIYIVRETDFVFDNYY